MPSRKRSRTDRDGSRPYRRMVKAYTPDPRMRQLKHDKVYSFKRTCLMRPFVWNGGSSSWEVYGTNQLSNANTVASSSGFFKFKLTDLPGYGDFTSFFQEFKITGIKLRFMPYVGTDSVSAATATAPYQDTMAVVIDKGANDQVPPLGPYAFTDLLQHQDVKLYNCNKPFTVWIGKPQVHQPVDGVTQVAQGSPWLDLTTQTAPNVDYHGLKFMFANSVAPNNAQYLQVYATYYIKCRNPM